MERLRGLLQTGLEQLGAPSSAADLDRWVMLASLLEAWNQRINLSGHRDLSSIARLLLLESAALAGVLPEADSIADLGSGAGIPGLPIALCRPGTRVLLVESRQRRHHFQRAAIRELGLDNVVPLLGRIEALAVEPCGGVVSQALSSPEKSLGSMRRWARPGGWLAVATNPAPELPRPEGLPLGRLVNYAAPAGPQRAVWITQLNTSTI